MKCPDCGKEMEKVQVLVEDAESKAESLQCGECGHVEFEPQSAKAVVTELRLRGPVPALEIEQRIVKLSHERLGIYFNRHVVRSLNLEPGEPVWMSVPSKKTIILRLSDQ